MKEAIESNLADEFMRIVSERISDDFTFVHHGVSTLKKSHMKYKLLKDLPTFKAGTIAQLSQNGNLVNEIDEKTIVMYAASTLAKFPSILTEWFEPLEEKRKVVPVKGDKYFMVESYGEVKALINSGHSTPVIKQGNWRWTREEAEAEVAKRAAIERVRRYLVENDLIEEDETKNYYHLYREGSFIWCNQNQSNRYYSPYGRIKQVNISQFLEDFREDLLLIHK